MDNRYAITIRSLALVGAFSIVTACTSLDGLEENLEEFDKNEIIELTEGLRDTDFDFSADRINRTINMKGQETQSLVKILRRGSIVRYDYTDTIDRHESSIFDYEKMIEYRIFEGDQMFFELDLPDTVMERAQREGLVPLQADPKVNVNRYVLGETEIEGHPSEIILIVRTLKGEPTYVAEYTLLIEALDLHRQPLRVAYNPTKRVLKVIEYRNAMETTIETKKLEVPEDFSNFTPF